MLVVQRYDRLVQADGTVQRLHQEDSCQALGFPPRKKYQEDGGPSLRQVAGLVQAVAPRDDLDDLVRAVVLNVVLGNGDAHGKNFSLVHEPAGGLRLAPLYDVLCTSIYGQNRLAMYIDSVQRVERVTVERIVNEATGWGMPRSRAREIVADFLARIPRAVDRAAGEITGVPPDLLDFVVQQLERVAKRESEPSHGA